MPVMRPEKSEPSRVAAELEAMQGAYTEIAALDRSAQERVLNWLTSRLGANWVRHDYPVDFEKEPPF